MGVHCVAYMCECALCVHVHCVMCMHGCALCCVHARVCTVLRACMSMHCVRACAGARVYTCRHVRRSLTRSFPPQSAAECSASLRALHGLELGHLRRSLALQKEEDFARARRQLAVFQRSELHNIFFAQIKSAIFKGELKPEAAKMLLQDYCNIQVMPVIGLQAHREGRVIFRNGFSTFLPQSEVPFFLSGCGRVH